MKLLLTIGGWTVFAIMIAANQLETAVWGLAMVVIALSIKDEK